MTQKAFQDLPYLKVRIMDIYDNSIINQLWEAHLIKENMLKHSTDVEIPLRGKKKTSWH